MAGCLHLTVTRLAPGFIWTFVLLGLSMSPIAGVAFAAGTTSTDCAIGGSLKSIRPHAGGAPVPVKIGITLIDIVDLNDVTESFKADFLLHLQWQDPRLTAQALGRSLQECRFGIDDIWSPDIRLTNRRAPVTSEEPDVDIAADGTVRFAERVFADLFSPLELQNYPFDVQRLRIHLASFAYSPQDVVFIIDDREAGRARELSVTGWEIVSTSTEANVAAPLGALGDHARVAYTIVLGRQAGYYVWKVFIPLSFIVLMAWSVFWIDPQASGTQIGVATASVFALVAFILGLGQLMPRVDYLTRADRLVLGATVLVFLALAEVIVTSRLAQQGRRDLAQRIDRHARWIYLTSFVLLLLFTLV